MTQTYAIIAIHEVQALTVAVWVNKSSFRIGETVRVTAKTDQTCTSGSKLTIRLPDGRTDTHDFGNMNGDKSIIFSADEPLGMYLVIFSCSRGKLMYDVPKFGIETKTAATTFVVYEPFDFALDISPTYKKIQQGESASYDVTVRLLTRRALYPVSLSLQGFPDYSFSTTEAYPTYSSRLTISTSLSTQPGVYELTIVGRAQNLVKTTAARLEVLEKKTIHIAVSIDSNKEELGYLNNSVSLTISLYNHGNTEAKGVKVQLVPPLYLPRNEWTVDVPPKEYKYIQTDFTAKRATDHNFQVYAKYKDVDGQEQQAKDLKVIKLDRMILVSHQSWKTIMNLSKKSVLDARNLYPDAVALTTTVFLMAVCMEIECPNDIEELANNIEDHLATGAEFYEIMKAIYEFYKGRAELPTDLAIRMFSALQDIYIHATILHLTAIGWDTRLMKYDDGTLDFPVLWSLPALKEIGLRIVKLYIDVGKELAGKKSAEPFKALAFAQQKQNLVFKVISGERTMPFRVFGGVTVALVPAGVQEAKVEIDSNKAESEERFSITSFDLQKGRVYTYKEKLETGAVGALMKTRERVVTFEANEIKVQKPFAEENFNSIFATSLILTIALVSIAIVFAARYSKSKREVKKAGKTKRYPFCSVCGTRLSEAVKKCPSCERILI